MPVKAQGAVLIIPALNEEPVIARTLAMVPQGLFRQIIVADNGSTDRTAEVARAAGATVVRQPERGYGAACLAALEAVPADCAAVVFLQADSSEDPSKARDLLTPIFDGRADLVLGSRVLGNATPGALLPHQRFGNWLATRLIRLLWGYRYTDLGPFRAIRLESLRALEMQDRNYGWTIEMQVKALEHGLRVLEIPVDYGLRAAGENKVSGNWKASLRAGVVILKVLGQLWLRRPA
ncbi:MAG: glycosyltransferase family 2 protein [Bryobacteraceae bacterium]